MKIYFIRHGHPDYVTDTLTQKGHIQAKKLAENIERLGITKIYQSPMGRARQTAEYSAAKLGINPITLNWLQEICWGDKSGDAFATESPWSLNASLIQEEGAYPPGESWKTHPKILNDRIVQDIEQKTAAFDNFLEQEGFFRKGQLYLSQSGNVESIAFFCHGGVTSALTGHLLNIPFWQTIAHFTFDLTSVSRFTLKSGILSAAVLDYLNDTSHLKNA